MKLGIDEAGRGPVIGNMFVAGVVLSNDAEAYLRSIGVKDSKKLTRLARARLFDEILMVSPMVCVRSFEPSEIDLLNINHLFVSAVIDIAKLVLHSGIPLSEVYVDAVKSRDLIPKLRSVLGDNVRIVVEERADSKYIVVGAASIIAKHLRDTHIAHLHARYGDFGSGYPSDPKTLEWLKRFKTADDLPPIVRKSWGTLKRLGIRSTEGEGILKWLKK